MSCAVEEEQGEGEIFFLEGSKVRQEISHCPRVTAQGWWNFLSNSHGFEVLAILSLSIISSAGPVLLQRASHALWLWVCVDSMPPTIQKVRTALPTCCLDLPTPCTSAALLRLPILRNRLAQWQADVQVRSDRRS